MANLDKSRSENDMQNLGLSTPPNFINIRHKRKRSDDLNSEFSEFKEEIKEMFSAFIQVQQKEANTNAALLKEIQQTNKHLEQTISYLSEQNDEFKKKINHLEEKAKEDRKYISILEDKIENIQLDIRKSTFEIKNAPKKLNETKDDLVDMVLCLSKSVGCLMNKNDIRDIYRIRGKTGNITNTPVIVETSSTLIKNEIIRSSKAFNLKQQAKLTAKHLGLHTSEDTPIFISEQLTAKAARLHFLARDLVKSKLYKYCWTAYGRVYVRKEDNSPVIVIKSEAQIHNLTLQK